MASRLSMSPSPQERKRGEPLEFGKASLACCPLVSSAYDSVVKWHVSDTGLQEWYTTWTGLEQSQPRALSSPDAWIDPQLTAADSCVARATGRCSCCQPRVGSVCTDTETGPGPHTRVCDSIWPDTGLSCALLLPQDWYCLGLVTRTENGWKRYEKYLSCFHFYIFLTDENENEKKTNGQLVRSELNRSGQDYIGNGQ
jgi:hypothetical protein